MPDQTLSCREVRLHMHETLRSEPSPAQPAEPAGYPWSLVLVPSLFAVFGLVLWRSGNLSVLAGSLIAAIAHPAILAAATAVEAAAALWWLWRVYTRQS